MPKINKLLKLLILVEGVTEETLLPAFSKAIGIDFSQSGIKIISSGGKNRILRLYEKLSIDIDIPIFIIFDSDASDLLNFLHLRDKDSVYLIEKGEFEDILPDKLICKTINNYYRLTGNICMSDLSESECKSKTLYELYKKKGFGEFKKAEFAKIIAENIKNKDDMSQELNEILETIKRLRIPNKQTAL